MDKDVDNNLRLFYRRSKLFVLLQVSSDAHVT
jgi:hypothetical protein